MSNDNVYTELDDIECDALEEFHRKVIEDVGTDMLKHPDDMSFVSLLRKRVTRYEDFLIKRGKLKREELSF